VSFNRVRSRPRPAPPCPCCGHPTGLCEAHRSLLRRLRDEMDGEAVLKSVGNGKRKKALAPRCCMPGCFESRARGESFCWEHESEEAA
jgi:hypothetical protein